MLSLFVFATALLASGVHGQQGSVTTNFTFSGVTGISTSLPLQTLVTTNYGGSDTLVVITSTPDLINGLNLSVSGPPDSKQAGVLLANLNTYVAPQNITGLVKFEVPAGSVNLIMSNFAQTSAGGNLSVSGPAVNPYLPLEIDSTSGALVQVTNASSVGLIANLNLRTPGGAAGTPANARPLLQASGNYSNVMYEGGPSTFGSITGNVPAINVTMYSGAGLNVSAYDMTAITGTITSFQGNGDVTLSPGSIYYNDGSCDVTFQGGNPSSGQTSPCIQTPNVGGGQPPPQYAGR